MKDHKGHEDREGREGHEDREGREDHEDREVHAAGATRPGRGKATSWGVAAWASGVGILLVAMPLAARGRLPDRLATHWGAASAPDGSLPLWAAAALPAVAWALLVSAVALASRRGSGVRGWAGATLLSVGVGLTGAQAVIVRANLDRSDWHQARSATLWFVVVIAGAVTAALIGVLLDRRATASAPPTPLTPGDPALEIPEGERFVWLSRVTNPWFQLSAAAGGLVAVAGALAGAAGLVGNPWPLIAPFAFVSVGMTAFSTVRARVTERGLEVGFGPLGWPTRRWAVGDIESARVERRTPAQVGGWGYRLNGLGTTVMLRAGDCLVVRARGKDFAVSVDDAGRAAALLNSSRVRT
ncbi:DUF1648 domain-containing protein [Streptomyces sp. NPDC060333]|uniref:DUF1648 domain-containing protein n=1 Tax=Streptomyces sp. NPDC060333 TaxID=3347098 RepID=UPI003655699F